NVYSNTIRYLHLYSNEEESVVPLFVWPADNRSGFDVFEGIPNETDLEAILTQINQYGGER
ncbi:MAG: hypothetical protein ACRCTY_05090, partial [Candidatus Adiutrix sp.]